MSLPKTTLAAVTVSPRKTEMRELPIPEIDADSGILRVEAAGVCGADFMLYGSDLAPRVMGHENIGSIAAVGRAAANRWGVSEGDRVVLEEYLPCGHCNFCRSSDFRMCMVSDVRVNPNALRYGTTPLTTDPGLWGGYSEYMYLHSSTVMHRVADNVSGTEASLALPLANGYEWTYVEGQAGPGETVVIFGPGQQGLGCVLASRIAGASQIIVTGLRRDKHRLEVALALGATHTLCIEDEPLAERVQGWTDGQMADLVVDTAAGNETTIRDGLDILKKRGRLVFAASTTRPLDGMPFGTISRKSITLKGVRGHSYGAVEWALATIASHKHPLNLMCSIERPLTVDGVNEAILGTGGELEVPVIHAVVLPGER
jgi:threonine dehydrogenase-like Zn-dependent dehydrogenase